MRRIEFVGALAAMVVATGSASGAEALPDPRYAGASMYGETPDFLVPVAGGKVLFDSSTASIRVKADGQVDGTQVGIANSDIRTVLDQADGKTLYAGQIDIDPLSGEPSNRLVRLNVDGSRDAGFTPPVIDDPFGGFFCLAQQMDGKILVGGQFTSVNGGTNRTMVMRLNSNGTLDAGFAPVIYGSYVYSMGLLTNGQILIGGIFTQVNGVARSRLARLNADGSLDTNFVGAITGDANGLSTLLVQPDGKVLLRGSFSEVNGVARSYLARLNADGTLDAAFNPGVDNWVYTAALQVDGKIWISGNFVNAGGQPRQRLALLNADGTADTNFYTTAVAQGLNSTPLVCQQDDGQVIVGVGYPSQAYPMLRFLNGTVSRSLAVPDSTQVQWRRGSNAPAIRQAWFDLSTDGGLTWTNLGEGVRVSGGWALTGLSLPGKGVIRARGRLPYAANIGAGTTSIDFQQVYDLSKPIMDVQQPVGFGDYDRIIGSMTNGAARTFDGVSLGSTTTLVFQVNNFGSVPLTLSSMSISGADASQFAIAEVPATSIAGPLGYTTFTLTFTPTSLGPRTATLHLAGNDPNRPSFTCTLIGEAIVGLTTDARLPLIQTSGNYPVIMNIAQQADGKRLLVGQFTGVAATPRHFVARLNADYSLDADFNPAVQGPEPWGVGSVVVQPDGRILIGGQFNAVGVTNIARLNTNGTVDTSFSVGLNGWVRQILIQTNGQLYVVGAFTNVNGQTRNGIARLGTNGALDLGFNIGSVVSTLNPLEPTFNSSAYYSPITTAALQPDGKVLIGGLFTSIGGLGVTNIARLNTNGTVDASFQAQLPDQANNIIVQPDGRILVAGFFAATNSINTNTSCIVRLNTNGTRDTGFVASVPGFTQFVPINMALQADGRAILDGGLQTFRRPSDGFLYSALSLVRVLTNGVTDNTFTNLTIDGTIHTMTIQPDGQILVGSAGKDYAVPTRSVGKPGLDRHYNDIAIQRLSVTDTTRIRWLRGISAPEATTVTFDLSIDGGTNWTALGTGARITGGWELTGLNLPDNAMIRGRARITGGAYGGATGIDEQRTAYRVSRSAVELDAFVRRIDGSHATIFTNLPGRTFTALTSTNLALPLSQWTELPAPVENPAGQYIITHAETNNAQRFYGIKSP